MAIFFSAGGRQFATPFFNFLWISGGVGGETPQVVVGYVVALFMSVGGLTGVYRRGQRFTSGEGG